ncbi:MAG TPA: SurA N-terminal domain-containing protein [Xanthobacteraceae bacterium]|jgi:peptidyl-prolyl cis-trans isomerase D|nr:SurA N-terminal domain-containing protein [Xanthobacteraceae bacterium]
MLRGIRKASENWLGRGLMAVVMTLLAGSFAVWGINDIFRGFGRAGLAKIGDAEISIDRFKQNYQDRLQQISREIGRPLPADRASALGLDRQVLGEMIAQAGLDQRVHQMGLGLSDADIARRITSDPKLQNTNGQFDRAKFELILRNMGYSEQRFVAEQRQDILRRQILGSVAADLAVPKAWLEALNQFENQQRSIEYIALGPAQAGDIPQPTDEELKKYFDERKILFRAPEYRNIAIVTVTPGELAKWMEVSDDDIKQAYDQRRSSFTTPEQRHVEQIVFPTLADAQTAADRIKNGAHFSEIASERGLKNQDIDLGTIPKSRIVEPAVADAAFTLQEGEVSAPIQTRFGAALVTVLQIVPETTQPLADATQQLRSDIALERAKSQVRNLHDKVEDDRAGGSTIEEAAAKLKLPVSTYEVDRSGRDRDGKSLLNIPHGADVVKAAFASDVGVDNDPIDADGGYIWYDVAAIAPARERTLDEVKAEVEYRWHDDEVASRLKTKAADLVGKLNSGEQLAALASADGIKVQTAKNIKRGTANGDISARMTDAVFQTAKDAYGSAVGDDPTQWVVFRVLEVYTPPLDANSRDYERMTQTVQGELSNDLIGQYIARLEDDLGISVNASVLAQAAGNSAPDTN